MNRILQGCVCLSMLVVVSPRSVEAASISAVAAVATWQRSADPRGNVNADHWVVNGTNVDYTTNDGQTLASDFLVGDNTSFSARIQSLGADNDRFGLVFGFQNAANNYRFSWEGGGFAEVTPSATRGLNFIREVGGVSTNLFNVTPFWTANVAYDVTMGREGSNVFFSMSQAGNLIASFSVVDTTFLSGQVGLWSSSQATRFSNLDVSAIPEPATLTLLGLGLAAIAARHRTRAGR